MSIQCRVEVREVRGKLCGLKIVHPDMGTIMDWGNTLEETKVRFVAQEIAFQMMADIERIKTRRFRRKQAEVEGVEPEVSATEYLEGSLLTNE